MTVEDALAELRAEVHAEHSARAVAVLADEIVRLRSELRDEQIAVSAMARRIRLDLESATGWLDTLIRPDDES